MFVSQLLVNQEGPSDECVSSVCRPWSAADIDADAPLSSKPKQDDEAEAPNLQDKDDASPNSQRSAGLTIVRKLSISGTGDWQTYDL